MLDMFALLRGRHCPPPASAPPFGKAPMNILNELKPRFRAALEPLTDDSRAGYWR